MPILDHSALISKIEEIGVAKISAPFSRQAALSILAGAFIVLVGMVPGCCSRRYGISKVIYHWVVVWCFNFIGAIAFTYLFVYLSGLTASAPYHGAVISVAEAK